MSGGILTGFHVTDRASAIDILQNGFFGDWGDVGFGVYFWMGIERARSYAERGGWDGRLSDPVILEVTDTRLRQLDPCDIHPEWDQEAYASMLWVPMDEGREDEALKPLSIRLAEAAPGEEVWGQDSNVKGLRLVRFRRMHPEKPLVLRWLGPYGGEDVKDRFPYGQKELIENGWKFMEFLPGAQPSCVPPEGVPLDRPDV